MPRPPRSPAGTSTSRHTGRKIDIIRASRGLTMSQLAAAVTATGYPMSLNTVSRTCRGRGGNGEARAMTVDELMAFAEALGVAAAVLIESRCDTCCDSPPPGFACADCGATTPKELTDGTR